MQSLVLLCTASGPTTNISVTSIQRAGPAVPPNFVGLSIEVSGVLSMIGESGDSAPLAQLLRNWASLTPPPPAGPVLRFGGNSPDKSCFGTEAPAGFSVKIERAPPDAYEHFARATAADVNVSYVIDANFGVSPDPHLVATAHVEALGAAGMWDLVRAVEIGNEIDIFAKPTAEEQAAKGHRNMSYNYDYYEPEFEAYVAAFREAGMPAQRVQGVRPARVEPAASSWPGARCLLILTLACRRPTAPSRRQTAAASTATSRGSTEERRVGKEGRTWVPADTQH